MTDSLVLPTPRYEWERLVRRIVMPAKHKLLALVLATYADPDGSRVRPGTGVLADVTGTSERAVKRSLSALRGIGLLTVTRRGGGRNGTGKTTEYQLATPADLLDRAELLDPAERRYSGATQTARESTVDNSESEATQTARESGDSEPNEGPPEVDFGRMRGQNDGMRGHLDGPLPTHNYQPPRPTPGSHLPTQPPNARDPTAVPAA